MIRITGILILIFLSAIMVQSPYVARNAYGFSVGDEKKVGEQLLALVRKEFKLIDEPDIIQYINELGQSTLAVAGPQYFDYHFFVIDNRELNAFAAPSGLIFFHSGLIDSLESEGELVGVVAHEIGHVVSRHLASRMAKNSKINAATTLGVLLGIALGTGPLSEAIVSGSVAAGQSASLSFSRLDEEEADRLAYNWMQEQKRNPAVMINMLRKIHNANRYRHGHIPPYLLTHPGPDIRMGYIQDLVLFGDKKPYVEIDQFPFLRFKNRIKGLTGDPVNTISQYQKIIQSMVPDSQEAAMTHYLLSQAYLAAADYRKAEQELRQTMAYYPGKSQLQADLGIIYLKSGNYQNAIAQLRESWKKDRNDLYASFYLAMALEKNGQHKEAVTLYEGLVSTIPDYPKLYYQLANLKGTMGIKDEGFYYYGNYYFYSGDFIKSKFNFEKAISLFSAENPLHAKAKSMLEKIASFEKEN